MLKKIAFFLALIISVSLFGCDRRLTAPTAKEEAAELAYTLPTVTPPSLSAGSAVLLEAESSSLLTAKNADKRMAMASTTKIMTALVALENSDPEQVVSVAADAVGVEGSSIYLFEGERITMLDLLYAMLLESANDAAAAIAIEVGGSIEGFSALMNDKADEMGLVDTHFVNPHGLYDDEHYTTARELALITAEALGNEIFRRIVSTKKHTLVAVDGNDRLLYNHNKMLTLYEGAIGVKTGYTKKSGRALVSAAERDGLTLIAVTLNAPDDWNDHKKLLDLGFDSYEAAELYAEGEFSYLQAVVGGSEAYIPLTNTEPLCTVLPRGARDSLVYSVEPYHRFEFAPISAGDSAGRLCAYLDGECVASSELVFATGTERLKTREGLLEKIKNLFS